MKKIITVLIICLTIVLLGGCSSNNEEAKTEKYANTAVFENKGIKMKIPNFIGMYADGDRYIYKFDIYFENTSKEQQTFSISNINLDDTSNMKTYSVSASDRSFSLKTGFKEVIECEVEDFLEVEDNHYVLNITVNEIEYKLNSSFDENAEDVTVNFVVEDGETFQRVLPRSILEVNWVSEDYKVGVRNWYFTEEHEDFPANYLIDDTTLYGKKQDFFHISYSSFGILSLFSMLCVPENGIVKIPSHIRNIYSLSLETNSRDIALGLKEINMPQVQKIYIDLSKLHSEYESLVFNYGGTMEQFNSAYEGTIDSRIIMRYNQNTNDLVW